MFSINCDGSVLLLKAISLMKFHYGVTLSTSWYRIFELDCHTISLVAGWNDPTFELIQRLLCVCSPTRDMKQSRQNQCVGYFPTVGSATIRRNLICLPRVSSVKYLFSAAFKRPWTVYVVRSKFVLICGQLLTRKTEISVCGVGVISAGFVCEGSIKASFPQYRHYLYIKSRFGNIVF